MTTCNCLMLVLLCLAAPALAGEFEQAPILYSDSAPRNRVSALVERIEAGRANLAYDEKFGYLRSLLTELNVPQSSQMLVFSKTSMQRHCISPKTPRALYFSDDVYVGYCQGGEVLEITAVDPQLGAVFYALDQDEAEQPEIARQNDNCLICHGSSHTKGVPGHVVRSVYSDAAGLPILASGTFRINQASPLEQRWGGWYVTGTHGPQKHLGNLVVRSRQQPEAIDNSAGLNITDLTGRFDTEQYLTPHSDIVALMVLEHQAEAQNRITHAGFQTRMAMHYEKSLSKELGKPADEHWPSTISRINNACESLVEYLLFFEEIELTHKIAGVSSYATDFAALGPRDKRGRSLRDFDLERRMFKYPCSYLVYSDAFAALPKEAKEVVFRRMWEVLSGEDQSEKFDHLSAEDRTAVREILLDTLPSLPEYWRKS